MQKTKSLLLVTFLLWLCGGCASGPTEIIPFAFALPGGELSGEAASADSWSDVVTEDGVLDLETRPDDPYSVRIGFTMRGDSICIDPGSGRKWLANLQSDSRVRIRIDQNIYQAMAISVTDAGELEGFDATRHVFRLDLQPND